jgi:hypothetical protein
VGDSENLLLVTRHLVEPDLMNLCGGQIGGRALLDPKRIEGIAIRQGPGTGIGATGGDVGAGQKAGEPGVGGLDLVFDGGQQLGTDLSLVCS